MGVRTLDEVGSVIRNARGRHGRTPRTIPNPRRKSRLLNKAFTMLSALPSTTPMPPMVRCRSCRISTRPAATWVRTRHPTDTVSAGEALAKQIHDALCNGPYWNQSSILITFDEVGGFFDHVPPPLAVVQTACPTLRLRGPEAHTPSTLTGWVGACPPGWSFLMLLRISRRTTAPMR